MLGCYCVQGGDSPGHRHGASRWLFERKGLPDSWLVGRMNVITNVMRKPAEVVLARWVNSKHTHTLYSRFSRNLTVQSTCKISFWLHGHFEDAPRRHEERRRRWHVVVERLKTTATSREKRLRLRTGSGDVKYHMGAHTRLFVYDHKSTLDAVGITKRILGFSHDRYYPEGNLHMTLLANPSHLEAVNTVVAGKARVIPPLLFPQTQNTSLNPTICGCSIWINSILYIHK